MDVKDIKCPFINVKMYRYVHIVLALRLRSRVGYDSSSHAHAHTKLGLRMQPALCVVVGCLFVCMYVRQCCGMRSGACAVCGAQP